MTENDTFRVVFIGVIAVFAPFALYRRIRSVTDEKLDRRQEGTFILFGLRLSGLVVFLAIVAWLIDPRWMEWSSVSIPLWIRWLGVVIVGCSGSLVVWTFQNLGKNLTDTVVTRRTHTLVTTGPYRWVRHPLYVALVLGLVGASLTMENWFVSLVGIIPVWFLVVRTRIEEQKLIDRFGVGYEEYMRQVNRFVPRWPTKGD